MTIFVVTTLMILMALVSAWGWGRLAMPLCYLGTVEGARPPMPYVATLGLAVLIVIGGVLNLLHIAYPVALEILFGFGLCAAIVFMALAIRRVPALFAPAKLLHRLRPTSGSKLRISGDLIPWFIILAATGFFAANLMPTSAFNVHDDFHKYLVAPIRMLQTGSLGGGPFEVVGSHHLGTQSFFQAFILTRFTPEYINGFDYIFCFLLAGFMLNHIFRKADVHWFYRSISMVALVFIHPQYVNISALYSGALFILATAYSALLFADMRDANGQTLPRATIPIGLFLASLISLKATFIPFALTLGALLVLGFLLVEGNRRRIAATGAGGLLAAAAVLVPWSVISTNNYTKLIASSLERIGRQASSAGDDVFDWGRLGELFFSKQNLFYGGWLPGYNFVVLTVVAAALISCYLLGRNSERHVRRYLVVGFSLFAATVIAYLFNAYVWTVKFGSVGTTVRYSTPIFIAVVPATVLVLGRLFWRTQPVPPGAVVPVSSGALAFVAALVLVVGLFADTFFTRAAQVAGYRTDLSFRVAKTKHYLIYNRLVLTAQARNEIRGLQSLTEKGATILVWIAAPFLIDYVRNRILNVESAGLMIDIGDKGFGGDAKKFHQFLKSHGIRYVLWQFKGSGIKSNRKFKQLLRNPGWRTEAEAILAARGLIQSLKTGSKVLYDGNQVVLFDIGE